MNALLLIDIQNDYFPGGRMELVGSEQAGQQAGRLLHLFRDKAQPVFHVQHISVQPGASFFLPDTAGADIHSSVRPLSGETIIQKHYPNCFRDTRLAELLKANGINQLTIAGMMTHMCVEAAVRAAFDLGFAGTLAHDACATLDLSFAGRTVPARDVQTACLAALGWGFTEVRSVAEIQARLS